MYDNLVVVFTSSQLYEIEIIRGLLLENDIDTFIINKQDSLYLFGDIELFVSRDNFLLAKQIILKHNNSE